MSCPTKEEKFITLSPDHYLWPFIPRAGSELIFSIITDIHLTESEYNATIKNCADYIKNSVPKKPKLVQEDIVNNDVFLPRQPNDTFVRKLSRHMTANCKYSTVNLHVGSHVEFYEYSYNNLIKSLNKASKQGTRIRVILNGRDMSGYHLALAMQTPVGMREITADSSVFIDVNLIDAIDEKAASKAIDENDKIFQTYEKQAPKLAELLKGKEQMVSEYFHKRIMETVQKELSANGGEMPKIDSYQLIAKTPGLSIQDLKNSCRTYLNAQQCIEYNLFGKIKEK